MTAQLDLFDSAPVSPDTVPFCRQCSWSARLVGTPYGLTVRDGAIHRAWDLLAARGALLPIDRETWLASLAEVDAATTNMRK